MEDHCQRRVDKLKRKCPDNFPENECCALELMVDYHNAQLNYDIENYNRGKNPPVSFEPTSGQKGTFQQACVELEERPVHPASQAVWNEAHGRVQI